MSIWELVQLVSMTIIWVCCAMVVSVLATLVLYLITRIFTAAYWRSKLDALKKHEQQGGE